MISLPGRHSEFLRPLPPAKSIFEASPSHSERVALVPFLEIATTIPISQQYEKHHQVDADKSNFQSAKADLYVCFVHEHRQPPETNNSVFITDHEKEQCLKTSHRFLVEPLSKITGLGDRVLENAK